MSPRSLVHTLTLCLFLTTVLSPIEAASPTRRARADSLFAATIRDSSRLALKDRIRCFRETLDLDDDHAPAHHQLARCYIEQGTVASRMSAETELLEALRRDRDNVDYNLTYGDLLWRKGFLFDSRERYERVLKLDPKHAGAASAISRYYLFDMFRYRDMRAVVRDSFDTGLSDLRALFDEEPKILALHIFGERDRNRAIEYLTRALVADPDHKPSVGRLCLLHFEDRRPDKLLSVADGYLERHPDDREVLLYRGLGLQTLGRSFEANETYAKALALMPMDERAVMEDVDAPPSRSRTGLTAADLPSPRPPEWRDPVGLSGFWSRRDPLLLTPFNENRLEHYGRVAYANLRFSRPEEGIPGWRTEQGQVYIRYGRYLARTVLRPSEIGQIYHETWTYAGFNVTFQNWDGLDHWRFESYRSPAYPGPVSDVKDLYRRFPGTFEDPYQERKYLLPHQVIAFKGEEGKIRIEASYAVPLDGLSYQRVGDRFSVDVARGHFLLDTNRVAISRKIVRETSPRQVAYDPRGAVYTEDQFEWVVPPGDYIAAAEVCDNRSGKIGQFGTAMDARRFARPGLSVSDPLLARDIRRTADGDTTRAGFDIIPNPLRTYRTTDDLAVYFEVYGLGADGGGRTAYEIAYTLSQPRPSDVNLDLFPSVGGFLKEKPLSRNAVRSVVYRPGIDRWTGVSDAFRSPSPEGQVVEYRVEYQADPIEMRRLTPDEERQLGLSRKAASTTVTLRYEGSRLEEPRTLRIDLRHIQMGLRKLTISVRDLLTTSQVSTSTLIRVVE